MQISRSIGTLTRLIIVALLIVLTSVALFAQDDEQPNPQPANSNGLVPFQSINHRASSYDGSDNPFKQAEKALVGGIAIDDASCLHIYDQCWVVFDLDQGYETALFSVGIDDRAEKDYAATIRFQVDGEDLPDKTVRVKANGKLIPVSLNLQGKRTLRLDFSTTTGRNDYYIFTGGLRKSKLALTDQTIQDRLSEYGEWRMRKQNGIAAWGDRSIEQFPPAQWSSAVASGRIVEVGLASTKLMPRIGALLLLESDRAKDHQLPSMKSLLSQKLVGMLSDCPSPYELSLLLKLMEKGSYADYGHSLSSSLRDKLKRARGRILSNDSFDSGLSCLIEGAAAGQVLDMLFGSN